MSESEGSQFLQEDKDLAWDAAKELERAVVDKGSLVNPTIYKNQEVQDAFLEATEKRLKESEDLKLDGLLREYYVFGRNGIESFAKIEALKIKDHRRGSKGWLVAMVDMDGLKQINDQASHRVGDAMLVGLAGKLRGCLREIDVVGRYGGDELVVMIPIGDYKKARKMMEGTQDNHHRGLIRRIHERVDNLRLEMRERVGEEWPQDTPQKKPGQVSVGWHFFSSKDYLTRYREFLKSRDSGKSFMSFLTKEADKKMYIDKKGRIR